MVVQTVTQHETKGTYIIRQTKCSEASEYSYSSIPRCTHIYLLDPLRLHKADFQGRRASENKTSEDGLETIRGLEYDHDFVSTSGARFHTDHANLAIGVVPITTGKLSEILCSLLIGGKDTVIKWMRKSGLKRICYNMLRNMTREVTFLIHLQ
jgi:hypothetical protein